MSDRNAFDDMKRSREEEYFREREREILDRMRRRAELAAAAGTHDTEVLDMLAELGYSQDTVRLLYLVPVIQTAWVDGEVGNSEREAILELARVQGIEPGSGAAARLAELLASPPPNEFFERTMAVIAALLHALPEERREADAKDIVAYCTRVAEASSGLFGALRIGRTLSAEERAQIARVAEQLKSRGA